MAWQNNKHVRLPGLQIAPNQTPSISQRKRIDLTFLVGTVSHVDTVKQVITVDCRESVGSLQDIAICHPFAGNSSYILGMPEEGCNVILANQDGIQYPIAYLPHYPLGLEAKNTKKWPDGVQTNEQNNFFYRVRNLNQGDVALSSKHGVEMFLSDYLLLEDKQGNSIVLRTEDDTVITTSCNNYVFSSGLWVSGGIIRRNSIDASDVSDIPHVKREDSPKGRRSYTYRPGSSDSKMDPHYTEYLIEVEDRSNQQQPINDVNGSSNLTVRRPVIAQAMGNLVGNNPQTDFYGRMLRVIFFTTPDDQRGTFSFEPIKGIDNDTLGMAYSLFKPHSSNQEYGAFLGIDKEGHFFQFIPSATGGGLGNGRSMSILAKGNLKEIWGQDALYGTSWDLTTEGGVRWVLGKHNERDGNPYSNRSIDIRADGGSLILLGASLSPALQDFDNKSKTLDNIRDYLKIEKVAGKERKEISGMRETIITSSDKIRVEGAKSEQVLGKMSLSVGANLNVSSGDNYGEVVKSVKDEKYGSRVTVVNKGSVELTLQSPTGGDIKESIKTKGSKITKIKLGDITESIGEPLGRGNRTTSIFSGNYQVSIKQGNVNMSTKKGQITLGSDAGQIVIKSTTGTTIKTLPASNINIRGGTINLTGKTGTMSGIVTTLSHNCYVTGSPPRGSMSVKASV